jgi:hypothetical protein
VSVKKTLIRRPTGVPADEAAREQNGSGMALGKHVFIAHYLSQKIAARLGNALVYPTMPFAPTGDWGLTEPGVIDPAKKKGHIGQRQGFQMDSAQQVEAALPHVRDDARCSLVAKMTELATAETDGHLYPTNAARPRRDTLAQIRTALRPAHAALERKGSAYWRDANNPTGNPPKTTLFFRRR